MALRLATLSGAWARGSFKSVPCPELGSEIGWMMTFIRSRSAFHVDGSARGAIASRRVTGCAGTLPPGTASRVSMLADASASTAIAGFSVGRNSSVHSG